jgi:arginase family enzyme
LWLIDLHPAVSLSNQVFFRTDDAWDFVPEDRGFRLDSVDVSEEAKELRFISSANKINAFAGEHRAQFRPFTLLGSGDFHHLSAVWTRQFTEPFTILSFDNHPDWDIRPPYWSCGAWINRALENPLVETIAVWGCGNFECSFPSRLLGNRRAAKTHRLLVYPWRQKRTRYPAYLNPLRIGNWKAMFSDWLDHNHGRRVYVTIDLDCLVAGEAITNWENGRFTCSDLMWAMRKLRQWVEIIGGDLCGGWSRPGYATRFQKLASWFDHPPLHPPARQDLLSSNLPTLEKLWPVLTGAA